MKKSQLTSVLLAILWLGGCASTNTNKDVSATNANTNNTNTETSVSTDTKDTETTVTTTVETTETVINEPAESTETSETVTEIATTEPVETTEAVATTETASSDTQATGNTENNWQLSGKIGMIYPPKTCTNRCNKKSDQGKVVWRQQQQNYIVRLSDPFDRLVMRLEGNAEKLTAKEVGRKAIETTPDEFLGIIARDTGNASFSSLNPKWLSYWVTGRPAPISPVTETLENEFVQEGYRVITTRWKETAVGRKPTLIIVKKGEFSLRMSISEWIAPDGTVL